MCRSGDCQECHLGEWAAEEGWATVLVRYRMVSSEYQRLETAGKDVDHPIAMSCAVVLATRAAPGPE